jgi:uncharacterized protein
MLIIILKLAAAIGIIVLAILFYGIFIERYLVRFNRYDIAVPNLPEAFNGFTIVHISDVHLSRLVPYWFLKLLFDKVNSLEKDMIVCTGDYVLGKNVPVRVEKAWRLLSQLNAACGVYSVLGNCDYWGDARLSTELLAKSGQDIQDKTAVIEKNGERLYLAGAGDFLEHHVPLDEILCTIPEKACRIVLAHNPDTADTDFTQRIDLMLAGHTHGGQVYIPFYGIPMLPVKNKIYSFGLKRSPKNHLIFISKGIGWGIFPGRLNCLPEIPVLKLIPSRD